MPAQNNKRSLGDTSSTSAMSTNPAPISLFWIQTQSHVESVSMPERTPREINKDLDIPPAACLNERHGLGQWSQFGPLLGYGLAAVALPSSVYP